VTGLKGDTLAVVEPVKDNAMLWNWNAVKCHILVGMLEERQC